MNFAFKSILVILMLSFMPFSYGQGDLTTSNEGPKKARTNSIPIPRENVKVLPSVELDSPIKDSFVPQGSHKPTAFFTPHTKDVKIDDNQYAVDNFFGCQAEEYKFSFDLGKSIDFNSCFNTNVSLQGDLAACRCLQESSLDDVNKIMNIPLQENQNITLDRKGERYYRPSFDQVLSGVAYQASLLVSGKQVFLSKKEKMKQEAVKKEFINDYSQSPFNYDPKLKESFLKDGKKLILNLKPNDYSSIGKEKFPYSDIVNPDGTTSPVCLPMTAFQRWRQIPSKDELVHFKSDLEKDYNKDDWDYNELQEKYDRLMKKSKSDRENHSVEIIKLKSKLAFLNRSPLVKYILGAGRVDKKTLSTAEKSFDLDKKQAELFNLLKTTFTGDNCKNKKYKECGKTFDSNLKKFFLDKDHTAELADIARSQMRNDIENRAKKIAVTFDKRLNSDQLNKHALEKKFKTELGLERPLNCNPTSSLVGPDDDVELFTDQCLKTMSAYCQFLKPYEQQINNDSQTDNDKLADTLSSELEDDFNFDPNTNKRYQIANHHLCNTEHESRDGSTKDTFFSFKEKYCKDPRSKCDVSSPEGWAALRDKYYEQYDIKKPHSTQLGNNDDVDYDYGSFVPDESSPFITGDLDPNCTRFCVGQVNDVGTSNDSNPRDISPEAHSNGAESTSFSNISEDVRNAMGNKTSEISQGPDSVFNGPYQNFGSQNLASKEVQDDIVNQLEERIQEAQVTDGSALALRTLQADLASIRASFAQSQLTNKSLNDKLAALEKAQEIMTRNNLAPTAPEEVTNSPEKGRFPSSVPHPRAGLSDLDRTISSVRENQNTSPATKGSSVSSYVGGGGRMNGGSESSLDAVRREEGKLINVESSIDGRLTVTTASRGAGVTANALSVEVPLNLYQSIQANPEGIDLSKIRISEEQMSQVQSGEFTLLVNSGDGNPPFKVQVQIKNKRLVRADKNNDGQPDKQVQTVRLNDLNLVFRPLIQAQAN